MRTIKSKKTKLAAGTATLVLIGGGAAFAYWTANGSGTGSATTSAGALTLTAVQTSVVTGMQPGDTAQTLSGNFDNRSSDAVHVGTVRVRIASVRKAPGAAAGTCDAGDFTLANRVVQVDADIPSGSGQGAWTGPTIAFDNQPGVNQNACMGAAVKLRYSTS